MSNDNSLSNSPSAIDRDPNGKAVADPFANLESLRLSQSFGDLTDVRAVITSVAVRKPHRHEFVRVRKGIEWRFETGTFTNKDDRETFLVVPALWSAMPGDVTPTMLAVAISRSSPVPFIWPMTLPSADGRSNLWHESAIEAARIAEQQWVRVVSDMSAGCYVPFVAKGELADPEWPDLPLVDLMRLAFKGRLIDDPDHPALRRLRGEL